MVAKLILYWICEISHYTKNMLQYKGLHLIFGFPSCRGFAFSIFRFSSIGLAFDFIQCSKSPDAIVELRILEMHNTSHVCLPILSLSSPDQQPI